MSTGEPAHRDEIWSMLTGAVACCPGCRLVQEPGQACTHCGDGAPVFVDQNLDRFVERSVSDRVQLRSSRQSWSFLWKKLPLTFAVALVVTAGLMYLFSSMLESPLPFRLILAVLGGVGAAALVSSFFRGRYVPAIGDARLSAVPHPAPGRTGETGAWSGTASGISGTVRSHLTGDACLAASLVIAPTWPAQAVYLRSVRATRFLVARESGEQAVVEGAVWVTGEAPDSTGQGGAARKAADELGIDGRLHVPGTAFEVVVQEGREVSVLGEEVLEVVPGVERGYRDDGQTTVIRGAAGRPVLVVVK